MKSCRNTDFLQKKLKDLKIPDSISYKETSKIF